MQRLNETMKTSCAFELNGSNKRPRPKKPYSIINHFDMTIIPYLQTDLPKCLGPKTGVYVAKLIDILGRLRDFHSHSFVFGVFFNNALPIVCQLETLSVNLVLMYA